MHALDKVLKYGKLKQLSSPRNKISQFWNKNIILEIAGASSIFIYNLLIITIRVSCPFYSMGREHRSND